MGLSQCNQGSPSVMPCGASDNGRCKSGALKSHDMYFVANSKNRIYEGQNHSPVVLPLQVLFSRNTIVLKVETIVCMGVAGAA